MRTLLLILLTLFSLPAFSSLSYTKIANNGTALPDSAVLGSGASNWACTRDNVTGLLWEVKTADGALRDKQRTYTNYDDTTKTQKFNGSAWLNPTQAEIDAASNSNGFAKAVNALTLCGRNDWKVPNKESLLSVMDPAYNPRINPTYFPDMVTSSANFWSTSPFPSSTYGAYYLSFYNFFVGYSDRNQTYKVRLVSDGQASGTFSLQVRATGNGSVASTAGGISCVSSAATPDSLSGTCLANLPSGTTLTLTATPVVGGNSFSGWDGDCSGTSATCSLTMNTAKTAIASFTANQVILFGVAPNVQVGQTGTVSATASSGLPVTFSSITPGICSVSDTMVTGLDVGTCTIAANQEGDGNYGPAPQVTQSFGVTSNVVTQTITFGMAPILIVGGTGSVSAAASSGLPVTFGSITPDICDVSDNTATGLAFGICTIAADQSGDGINITPAPQVRQSFTVGSGNLLLDAGFENGGVSWSQSSSSGTQLIVHRPAAADFGVYMAALGSAAPSTDVIEQSVTIPPNARTLNLEFWYAIGTEETNTTLANDTLEVALYSADVSRAKQTLLVPLTTLSNLSPVSAWLKKSVSINASAYQGQTVTLRFTATNNASLLTSFSVDNVSLTTDDLTVEFYNTNLDNYFITADPSEAGAIDNGSAGPGWSRTGNNFKSGGSTPVCRFYGSQSPGPNSHFYTVDPGECASLKALQASTPATEKRWNFESLDFYSTRPIPGLSGAPVTCPTGTTPVYRAYNNGYARGVDSNHRISSNQTAIQQVVARGWISEGVVMCAPL